MLGFAYLTFIVIVSTVTTIFADAPRDQDSATYVPGMTPGRAKSLIGVALGVSSLIIGWRTKARSKKNLNVSKSWPIVGGILGLTAVGLSILHLMVTTGGFGTGGGKAGAIVALLVGVSGTILSVLALRKKKMSSDS